MPRRSRTGPPPKKSTRRPSSTRSARRGGWRRTSRASRSRTATGCWARRPRWAATRASPTCWACASGASPAGSSPAPTTSTSCRCSRGSSAWSQTGRPRSSSAATSPSSRRSATPPASMRDELARAYAFLAWGDMGGTRAEETPSGRAVFTDELPHRLDGNYLWVDRYAEPETLVAEAEQHRRRLIFVPDPELGDRLAPWFERQGWRVDRHVVMAQLREPQREADVGVVRELGEEG